MKRLLAALSSLAVASVLPLASLVVTAHLVREAQAGPAPTCGPAFFNVWITPQAWDCQYKNCPSGKFCYALIQEVPGGPPIHYCDCLG